MFEADGAMEEMHGRRSSYLRSSTNESSSTGVLDSFTWSPQKSASRNKISRARIDYKIFKFYVPQLLHTLYEDDPD
ncbi:hypothetical protein TNCV_3379551 [Trichonephila clavipes]|nr:hypothetical protein TNCV_3379551 [Trichonephila clavipes]